VAEASKEVSRTSGANYGGNVDNNDWESLKGSLGARISRHAIQAKNHNAALISSAALPVDYSA